MARSTTQDLVRRYFVKYRRPFGIGGLLLVVTNLAGLSIPWLLKLGVEALQRVDAAGLAPIAQFALLIVVAAILQMIVRVGSRLLIFGAGRDIEYDLRNELLAHLETLQPSYYVSQSTGDIISRASNDLGGIRLLFGPAFLNVVNTGFVLVASLSMMLIIDVRLTLLALAPVPLVLLAVRAVAAALTRQFFEVQQFLGALSGHLQEVLSGVLVIKAFVREPWAQASFDRMNEENFRRYMGLAKTRGLMMPMMGAVGGLGTFVILLFGGYAVIDGRISLGDFVAFNGYLAMLVWPMLALGWVYAMIQRGAAAARRLNEVLNTQPSIRDADDPCELPDGGGALQFKGLTSSYRTPDGELRHALRDIDLEIASGCFVGITGPVGSGKSTLLRVLLRLQETESGATFLDGEDVTRIRLSDLRTAIAYVPQEPFLFSISIRDNVGFGKPDFSDDELRRAAEMSGLAKDLPQFSHGYETVVGERGVTLSGGQRQRVALARALLRRPRLLLLDDALSAVDAQTEEEILGHLQGFMQGRTSLVATHRLASIRNADTILVLDHGRLVERGTHEELVAAEGLYARLWKRQQLVRQIEEFG